MGIWRKQLLEADDEELHSEKRKGAERPGPEGGVRWRRRRRK